MNDPVAALETWCDEEERLVANEIHQSRFLAVELRQQREVINAYRAIISEYRELRPSPHGQAYQKGLHRTIELLAAAHVKQEHDPYAEYRMDIPEQGDEPEWQIS